MKAGAPLLVPFAAAAILLFAGCGKKPAAGGSHLPREEAISPEAAEAKKLNLLCWSEYVPQEVIDGFERETGIKVAVENYSSNEQMRQKLASGGGRYDLIQPGEYIVEALVKGDLLEPIDHAHIPNLANIAPEFQNLPFDPGNRYSVPWMAGFVGIVVNTELVQDEIKGYGDVFQDKFKNKIVVLDDSREIVSWALASQGIPVNDLGDENLAKIKPVLSKWLPLVRFFDSDSPKTSLIKGDVALGVVWSGEGAILVNQNPKFKWVVPAEGSHLFVDNLAIPKGAKHVRNAELFMDFILRPEISKLISDSFPYLNPNLRAREILTPKQLSNPASFPSREQVEKMSPFRDIGAQSEKIEDLITSLKVQ